MGVRLPDPPRSGDPQSMQRWANDLKLALEQQLDALTKNNLLPTFSSTATSGAAQLPSAQLPARWIYVKGTATSGPAWPDGTAWRWGTGASVVVS